MSIIARDTLPVKFDPEPFDPDADDRLWWAQNGVDFYADPDDAYYDQLAAEREAEDRLERGLHPDDVARVFGYRAEHDHGDAVDLGPTCGHGLD